MWSWVFRLGGGSGVTGGGGSAGARLAIFVPGGVSHDPYHVNPSVRVMQPANDVDFQLEHDIDRRSCTGRGHYGECGGDNSFSG